MRAFTGNGTAAHGRRLQLNDVTSLMQVRGMNHLSHAHPIRGAPSFVTSSVHFEWCMHFERFQVDDFVAELSQKRGNCVVYDVGMNDGFYTMLSAAMGCRVHAFDVQDMCVEIARRFVILNHFDHVTVVHQPVSANHDEKLAIPSLQACDGGFTFSGAAANATPGTRLGHLGIPLVHKREFRAITLDAYVPPGTMIDILKIDTEGHEPLVLRGAQTLFRSRRIRRAWIEANPSPSPTSWRSFNLLHRIMTWGYAARVVGNGPCPRDVFYANDWTRFHAYLLDPTRNHMCVDVLLSLTNVNRN